MEIFLLLDKLRPTAAGLDQIPAWFLRLAAPIIYQPLTRLFNLSISTGTVRLQWKQAIIRPVPKVAAPTKHDDFRPISITPFLTRLMERTVMRRFLYPAFLTQLSTLAFHDQFGLRPTGSTTAAFVYTLYAITSLLSTNPFVIVIALDFSKAFDTVRHSTLLHEIAKLEISENVYNWLLDFLQGQFHCTEYNGQSSALREISASIIQGSSIGPAMYVVEAADLHAVDPGNLRSKYADDTCFIIPASNSHTRTLELEHIEAWSKANNITLNRTKSVEIIFTSKKCKVAPSTPPPLPGITRCSSLTVFGITVTNTLSVAEHVQDVTKLSSQTMHVLRILRSYGMPATVIQQVFSGSSCCQA